MQALVSNDARRADILAAALACFNERGVEGTAIGEISLRAHASVGSIYHHFGSKDGIAAALLVEGLHDNARQLDARLRKARGCREGVLIVVGSLIDWIVANPEWARFIYTVGDTSVRRNAGAELREVNAYYADTIDGYFRPYREAGAFRPFPPECFASIVLGPAHDYARRWLNNQVPASPKRHLDEFAGVAWNSVRKAAARKR